MIAKRYVDTRFGQIHLRECGDGPVLLFAHANPWSSLFWEPVLPEFARAGYRAIAYDALGYGLSDRGAAALTIEGQAMVMSDLVASFDGGVAAVIGWHQGAVTALEFALGEPEACPVLVMDGAGTATDDQAIALARQVMANNPAYPFAGNESRWWADMALGRLQLFNPHFTLTQANWPIYRNFLIGSLEADPAIATSPSPMVPEAVRAALTPNKRVEGATPYYDWLARLPTLQSRLLILTADDEPLRPAHDDAVAQAPAGFAQVVYPGGHPLIGVGREADYAAPILDFLAKVAAKPMEKSHENGR